MKLFQSQLRSSSHSQPRHYVEVSDKLHAPVALNPGKGAQVPID